MHPVRFGVIGYGGWGSHHARAIAECSTADLTAIAVPSEASQARAREAHPAIPVVGDYRELLRRADVEAVAIVVPNHLHFAAARAALEAGKHVLLEKPMALRREDCDELTALAARRNRVLTVGHELRFSPLWGRVKELIDLGAIGEPRYALLDLWRRPYRLGAEGWRYDPDRVGDWSLEEPVHFFDLARWYFESCGEPVSVYARSSAAGPRHPQLRDNFSSILSFANGAYTVISQTLSAFEHHLSVKLTGTRGALWASWSGAEDRTAHPTFSLKQFDGQEIRTLELAKIPGERFELSDQLAAFVRSIRSGEPVKVTGYDGRQAVALCRAAQASSAAGHAVAFALIGMAFITALSVLTFAPI